MVHLCHLFFLIFLKIVLSLECPQNASVWHQREVVLSCYGDTLYHCLRDEGGKARESCLEKTWVQPGFCPEFNSVAKKMDVSLCQESRGKCPTRTYWSTDVYMYTACLPAKVKIIVPATEKPATTKTILIGEPPQSTVNKTAFSERNANGTKTEGVSAVVIVLLILIACAVIVGITISLLLYKRKRRGVRTKKAEENQEIGPITPFIDETSTQEEGKYDKDQETITCIVPNDDFKDGQQTDIDMPAAVHTPDGKKVSKDGKFDYSERFESVGKIVERAGPLLSENGILILVAQSKKMMAEVAQAVALTCDTQEYPEGFNEFNDSFARMDESSKTTKCVVFNDCFQKGGIDIKFYKHKSIFNDLYEKQLASGGRLRLVISFPMTIWNARRVTLSSWGLFNEKYVLKFKDLEVRNSKYLAD